MPRDEEFGFGSADEASSGRGMLFDMVDSLAFGCETVIGLDKDAVGVGADDGVVAGAMLDDGEVAFCVGDEEVFWHGAGDAGEGAQSLASGRAMLGDVAQKVSRREAVIPFINMGVSQTDIQAIFVNGILGINLAAAAASVTTPDGFIGKSEVTITAGKVQVVTLEEFASFGEPIVVAADENFAILADGEDCAAVLMGIDAAALGVDEAGEIFVKEKVGILPEEFGGSKFFGDEFGIIFLVDIKLFTQSFSISVIVEVMLVGFEAGAIKLAKLFAGT